MNITPKFIKEFWLHQPRFIKNNLATEKPSPLTVNLSQQCHEDLARAFATFLQAEINALDAIKKYTPQLKALHDHLNQCLTSSDGRIIIIGCGASGRAAVITRRICETTAPELKNRIISICSAGDVSLIRSVESFEDQETFGENQLIPVIKADDLVVGLSASGESPFVLGALRYAKTICYRSPWLIFNNSIGSLLEKNPSHILANKNNKINYIDLCVGEMALTGSTRLQATTAMQVALGITISVTKKDETEIVGNLNIIIQIISKLNLSKLSNITAKESLLVSDPEMLILYKTKNPILALSMLADITERAPTFNIAPLENWSAANHIPTKNSVNSSIVKNSDPISKFYLCLENTPNSAEAWHTILGNKPYVINWANFPQTTLKYILGFDLSGKNIRNQILEEKILTYNNSQFKQSIANWNIVNNSQNLPELIVSLSTDSCTFALTPDLLINSLILKIILNSHSTLMFGRLGYFKDNLMLSLSPTNFKLIDRAIRYTIFILKHKFNQQIDYKIVADYLFEELAVLKVNESIVDNTIDRIMKNLKPINEH